MYTLLVWTLSLDMHFIEAANKTGKKILPFVLSKWFSDKTYIDYV